MGRFKLEVLNLAVSSFIASCRRLINLITRPGRDEIWTSVKICLVGIGIIGVIGFLIKYISSMFQLVPLT